MTGGREITTQAPSDTAAAATAAPAGGRAAKPRRRRSCLRWAGPAFAGSAVLALGLRSLLSSRGQIAQAIGFISHPAAGWLCLAIACEAVSYLAYGYAQRRIARAAGARLSVRWLASLALAAQAVNNFVPGGYIGANVLNFRELRRRRLSAAESAWILVMTSLLYVGALVILALAASQIAGGSGRATAAVHVAFLAALGTVGLLAAGALIATRPRVRRLGSLAAHEFGRRVPRIAGACGPMVRAWLDGLSQVKLPKRTGAGAAGWFAIGWLADAACLACSFLAIGAAAPWTMLLLAYCAAQLVAFIPVTPGGLGLVEASLTIALGASGGGGEVLAAVLLYRFISYWGTLPAGALGYVALRRTGSRLLIGEPAGDRLQPRPAGLAPGTALAAAPSTPS